jgi:hypothetical protein
MVIMRLHEKENGMGGGNGTGGSGGGPPRKNERLKIYKIKIFKIVSVFY